MKNCVKVDYNISEADIQIRSPHDISIKIDREAQNPTITSLRQRIEDLEMFNLHLDDEVDRMLGQKIAEMNIVTRAALNDLLALYSTKDELQAFSDNLMGILAQEREYNDARYDLRYLQKAYVTQAQYDAMGENDKKPNTIYVIREN